MKIICIGHNYKKHIKELNAPFPEVPVIFMKPDTAFLPQKSPFYIPEFSQEIHYEIEVLVKISKHGKHIDEQFAHRYYDEIGLGIDFTARDLQRELMSKGLPWEKCKGFDGSAAVGDFISKSEYASMNDIPFSLKKNNEIVQQSNTSDMLFQIDTLISYISTYFTLKQGDIIFTGTPAGVDKVLPNDVLEGYIGDKKLITVNIK
jgi:2-keto-4-pentenoate hydratase/2-oxohepta-3-ene-1,7-dioic acid hydratase in catechol pathway